MRFAFAPPPTSPARVHSRGHAPFVTAPLRAVHVPPSWFRTTSTVCSARWFAGLLRPATGLGFAAFPVPADLAAAPKDGAGPWCLSRDAVHTLRRVPLASSQHRITAACCLLAVTGTNDSREQPKPRSTVVPGRSRDAPCVPPSEEGGAAGPRPFSRAGDAPIRRGRPPRHRARATVGRNRRPPVQHRRSPLVPKRRAWRAVRLQARVARPPPVSVTSLPFPARGRGEASRPVAEAAGPSQSAAVYRGS
jgi:hypothetical protein